MGFIRFIGTIIGLGAVIFAAYSGYKMYKQKNYFSKQMLITVIILVIGAVLASTLTNMYSKKEKLAEATKGIYTVKVTKTKVNYLNDWTISGTTTAPDNAKIIAIDTDGTQQLAQSESVSWAKVHNGRFTAQMSPVDFDSLDYSPGKKYAIDIFATTRIKTSLLKTFSISDKIINAEKKIVKPYTLKLSSKQSYYYNHLNDDSSSSSSEISSNSSSETSSSSTSESEYPDIASKFDLDNLTKYSDADLFSPVTLNEFFVADVAADNFHEYHLLLTPKGGTQEFLAIGKSDKKITLGSTISLQGMLNGWGTVNENQIKNGISDQYSDDKVALISIDDVLSVE